MKFDYSKYYKSGNQESILKLSECDTSKFVFVTLIEKYDKSDCVGLCEMVYRFWSD